MMRNVIIHLFLALFLLTCANINEPEYGILQLQLDWSQIQSSESRENQSINRLRFPTPQAVYDWPSGLHSLRITVMPGEHVFEFSKAQQVYELSLELGIYNILIEGLDEQGEVLFSSMQDKVLVETHETTDISLAMDANFPTAKTRFVDYPAEGRVDSTSFALTWEYVEHATAYRLQESRAGDFVDSATVYLGPDTVWSCSEHEGGQFAFRVRAEHRIQNTEWSEPLQLWIDLTPAVVIDMDSLPPVMIHTAYHVDLSASGGTPPYTWRVSEGELPPGLNVIDGSIQGTPEQTGVFGFTLWVEDSGEPAKTAERPFYLSVLELPPPLRFSTDALALARVGVAFEQSIEVSGGVPPYADWQVNSDAPFDLSLAPGAGHEVVLHCLPTQSGEFSVDISFSDSGTPPQQASQSYSLTVREALAPLTIVTDTLPDGMEAEAYALDIEASGGMPPYTDWQVSSTAPFDLTLTSQSDSSARLTGLPTEAGRFEVTLRVSDSQDPAQSTEKTFSLTILPALEPFVISTDSLPTARLNKAYSAGLRAQGGGQPYHDWTVSSDAPFEMSVVATTDSTAGLSCTPTAAGEFTVTVGVKDSQTPQQNADKQLSLRVEAPVEPLAIVTDSLETGRVNETYEDTLRGTGGVEPYEWLLTHDAPFEVNITSQTGDDAMITAIPTVADTFQITAHLTDQAHPPQSVQKTWPWIVAPPYDAVQITTQSFPDAYTGRQYKEWVLAQGGTPPYTWTLVQSDDPDLRIIANDPERGVLLFTPEETGDVHFNIRVTDSSTPETRDERSYVLQVHEGTTPLSITTPALPKSRVNVEYSYSLAAEGGVEPYTWEMLAPTYPVDESEFELSTDGLLTGRPWQAKTIDIHVRVTDADSPPTSVETHFDMEIQPAWLVLSSVNIPDGAVNESYLGHVALDGGTLPYSWQITGLPPGLSTSVVNNWVRNIEGTPTAQGDYTITVHVDDSGDPQQSFHQDYPVHIDADPDQLVITTASPLPAADPNQFYTQDIEATGATPATRVWDMVSMDSPFDMAISDSDGDGNGELEFFPNQSGTFHTTVKVFDDSDANNFDEKTFEVTVLSSYDPLQIVSTSPLPDAIYGTTYSYDLEASGGSGGVNRQWEIVADTVPEDVMIGNINGYGHLEFGAFTAGTFTLTVKVTDLSDPGLWDQAQFSVTVPAAP